MLGSLSAGRFGGGAAGAATIRAAGERPWPCAGTTGAVLTKTTPSADPMAAEGAIVAKPAELEKLRRGRGWGEGNDLWSASGLRRPAVRYFNTYDLIGVAGVPARGRHGGKRTSGGQGDAPWP